MKWKSLLLILAALAVQLVAYDDVVQYIVDGKLIYQIARGDRIQAGQSLVNECRSSGCRFL